MKPSRLTQIRNSKYFRAGVGSFFLRGGSIALALLGSVLMARVLGPSQLGLYSFALALVTIAGLPVQMGLPTLVLRETAKAEASNSWSRMRGIWLWAGRRIVLASVIVVPLTGLGAWLLQDFVLPGGLSPILLSLALIPMIGFAQVRGAALRGLHHPILGQLPESLVRPGVFALLLTLAWLLGAQLSAQWAMSLQLIAALLAFVVGTVLLVRTAPAATREARADLAQRSDWRAAIWPLAMLAGMQIVLQSLDILMLGLWRSAQEVGLYKIAVSAASLPLLGLTVVNLVIAPSFARLHARNDAAGLGRIAAIGAAVALATALPVAAVLVLAGHWILVFFYGEPFRLAYDPLAILVVGQVVNAFFGSVVGLLNMSGHERATLRGLAIATALNIGFNIVLIPAYGTTGAAVATLISTVAWNVLLGRAVRRHLGIGSTPFGLIASYGK